MSVKSAGRGRQTLDAVRPQSPRVPEPPFEATTPTRWQTCSELEDIAHLLPDLS